MMLMKNEKMYQRRMLMRGDENLQMRLEKVVLVTARKQ